MLTVKPPAGFAIAMLCTIMQDEKKALLRPTLFTGIIGWSLNELKPSYQEDSARGVDSPELLKESLHFLRNNTAGLYPTTQHETGGNLMLDLFWESFDIYYSPAHDGVWFKEEGDDGAGVARRKGPLQYDLAEVRPVNSILAYNLSCTLLEFCADIDTMVFVLGESIDQTMIGIMLLTPPQHSVGNRTERNPVPVPERGKDDNPRGREGCDLHD